ncbi:MAG: hypothetical protein VKK05_06955 [Synechococcus sp.]|nr:hypothetical protein [Synechococcus sp.]
MGVATAAAIASAGAQLYGAKKAADAQRAGSRRAREAQAEMLRQQREVLAPYLQGGQTSQNELMRLLGIGGDASTAGYGSMAQPFGMAQFQADPGYQFRMDEGMKALERSAAARGGLLSGGFLRGATRYGQGVAAQEYQNAFNRYQAERQARLAPLFELYGQGARSANALAGFQGDYGQGASRTYMDAADARASSYLTRAGALGNFLGQGAQLYGQLGTPPIVPGSQVPDLDRPILPGITGPLGG